MVGDYVTTASITSKNDYNRVSFLPFVETEAKAIEYKVWVRENVSEDILHIYENTVFFQWVGGETLFAYCKFLVLRRKLGYHDMGPGPSFLENFGPNIISPTPYGKLIGIPLLEHQTWHFRAWKFGWNTYINTRG